MAKYFTRGGSVEEARQELYKLLGSGAPEEKVVEQSQKLDQLIVDYYKEGEWHGCKHS